MELKIRVNFAAEDLKQISEHVENTYQEKNYKLFENCFTANKLTQSIQFFLKILMSGVLTTLKSR